MTDKTALVRYYAEMRPELCLRSNNKLPCAWGAVPVMLAFGKLPEDKRTNLINNAINVGVDFLFSKDPARADYPCGYSPKPSGNWWKFASHCFM